MLSNGYNFFRALVASCRVNLDCTIRVVSALHATVVRHLKKVKFHVISKSNLIFAFTYTYPQGHRSFRKMLVTFVHVFNFGFGLLPHLAFSLSCIYLNSLQGQSCFFPASRASQRRIEAFNTLKCRFTFFWFSDDQIKAAFASFVPSDFL
jgi:hypothetical protein